MQVTVVVPLYQKARWVERALASISAQTFDDFEVLVVDDGSTDDGPERVAAWPDRRVRLIRQPNGGPGAARNRGIAEARGRYLAFLDADDEWRPGFLGRSLRALERAGENVAAAVCGHLVLPQNTTREALWRRRGVREGVFHASPLTPPLRFIHHLAFMSPCATLIRADAVHRHGGFYARDRCVYGEDAYLFCRVLLQEPVVFRFDPDVVFHTDASALSNNLAGPRPLEPFLRFAEEVQLSCPRPLKPLLRQVLSIRASKTACMYAWWGRREEARALLRQFERERRPWHPWALAATLACSPLGLWAGAGLRALKDWLRRARPVPPEPVPPLRTDAAAHAAVVPPEYLIRELPPAEPLPPVAEPAAPGTSARPLRQPGQVGHGPKRP